MCDYPSWLAEKFTSYSVSAYSVLMLWKNVTVTSLISLYSVDWLALWCFMRIPFLSTSMVEAELPHLCSYLRPVGVWCHCLKFSCGTGLWRCFLCMSKTELEASQTDGFYLPLISHFCKYFLNRTKFDSVCLFIQKLSCFEQKNISFLRPNNNLTQVGEEKRVGN